MHPPIIFFDFDGVILTQKALELIAYQMLRNKFYKWNNTKDLRLIDLALLFEKSDNRNLLRLYKNIQENFKPYIPNRFRRDVFIMKFRRSHRKLEKIYDGLKPGILDILKKFKKEGAILGLISNTERARLNYFKKKFQLNKFFSVIFSRDDVPFHKPNPYPILYALKIIKKQKNLRLINKSRVFFIGDIPSDIICAKSARIKSIALLSGHGRKIELENEFPDYLIKKINDLSELPPFKKFLFQ